MSRERGDSAEEYVEAKEALTVDYLGRWLSAHFPGLTSKDGDPIEEAMELIVFMQHRLEVVAQIAGSPVLTGVRIALGGFKIDDSELAVLVKPVQEAK